MSSFLAVPAVPTVRVLILIRVRGLLAAVQLLVRPNQAPDLGLAAQKYLQVIKINISTPGSAGLRSWCWRAGCCEAGVWRPGSAAGGWGPARGHVTSSPPITAHVTSSPPITAHLLGVGVEVDAVRHHEVAAVAALQRRFLLLGPAAGPQATEQTV